MNDNIKISERLPSPALFVVALLLTFISHLFYVLFAAKSPLAWFLMVPIIGIFIIPAANIAVILWVKVFTDFILPRRNNALRWGAAALIVIFVSLSVPKLSEINQGIAIKKYKQDDFIGEIKPMPAHVKFSYENVKYSQGSNGNIKEMQGQCSLICQDLLLNQSVKTVSYERLYAPLLPNNRKKLSPINRKEYNKPARANKYMTFKIGEGDMCQSGHKEEKGPYIASLQRPIRSALLDIMVDGKCIVQINEITDKADITIKLYFMNESELLAANKRAPLFLDYNLLGANSVLDSQGQPVAREGIFIIESLASPLFISLRSEGESVIGPIKNGERSDSDPVEDWALKLIYPNIPSKQKPIKIGEKTRNISRKDRAHQKYVRARKVLDEYPASHEFNAAQLMILSEVLSKDKIIRVNEFSTDIARSVIKDQRVKEYSLLETAVRYLERSGANENKEQELYNLVFNRLQASKAAEKVIILDIIALLPEGALKDRGAWLMRELMKQKPDDIKNTYQYARKLGVSPVALFEKGISEYQDPKTLVRIAGSIRRVDQKWQNALIPSLDKIIDLQINGEGDRCAAFLATRTLNSDWNSPTDLSRGRWVPKTIYSEQSCRRLRHR